MLSRSLSKGFSVPGVICSGDEYALAPELNMLGIVGIVSNIEVKFRSLQARI